MECQIIIRHPNGALEWKSETQRLEINILVFTDIKSKLVVAKVGGSGSGKDWEFGVSKCKLLHLEWVNNKVLLYSTGNYSQSPGTDHDGK